METAIQVVWWIGLIGALAPTIVILKQVAVTVAVLRDIHGLATITRDAAQGIRANVAAGSKLAGAADPASLLVEASVNLGTAVHAVGRGLEAL